MSEKRIDPRRDLSYRCWILPGEEQEMISCRIHNVSQTGANLSVEDSSIVPPKFTLALTRDLQVTRQCEVAWTDGDHLGIKFIPESAHGAEAKKVYF